MRQETSALAQRLLRQFEQRLREGADVRFDFTVQFLLVG
jgi:hypothetical protein